MLGPDDVLPGVADIVTEVHVEAVFDDGSRLAVVSDPLGAGLGEEGPGALLPGPAHTEPEAAVRLTVTNTATVPVSVTSHFHFFEANPRLDFPGRRPTGCGSPSPPVRRSASAPGRAPRSACARSAERGSRSASPDSWTVRWTRPEPGRRPCSGQPPAGTSAAGADEAEGDER